MESLCKGLLALQSSLFWMFLALLHWLKEMDFAPPDPALFGQQVQEISGAMVSSAALAMYLVAKRREGILSHFPSHAGSHFKRELASSSFETPFLFDDEVLAKVIVASREDSHLDAQLSIAKAFTLPVFRGSARGSGRGSKASSSSSSGFRGSRGGTDAGRSKRKASSSPGRARKEKSPRRGSPSAKRKGFRR